MSSLSPSSSSSSPSVSLNPGSLYRVNPLGNGGEVWFTGEPGGNSNRNELHCQKNEIIIFIKKDIIKKDYEATPSLAITTNTERLWFFIPSHRRVGTRHVFDAIEYTRYIPVN
jgi:hypothetical protein